MSRQIITVHSLDSLRVRDFVSRLALAFGDRTLPNLDLRLCPRAGREWLVSGGIPWR